MKWQWTYGPTLLPSHVGRQRKGSVALKVGLLPAPYYITHKFFKVVPEGCCRIFFRVKVKTVKLIGGRYACPNHTNDGIHSDHGNLDTCDNPLGPP